jgi:GPH family glycoside/pentoside/hexuronide:cation symporter
MYAAAVPAALGFYFMWHAPTLQPAAMLAFVIGMLIFTNISFSLFEIPSLALAPELAPDYDQRSKLLGWRWLFLIGSGAAMNFTLNAVFLRQDAANPAGVLNRHRWEDFGLLAAVLIFTVILISTTATLRQVRRLHTPPARKISLAESLAELKVALTHRPLTSIMLGGLFMGFGAGTAAGLAAYFNLHFWGLIPQQISLIALAALPGSVIALWSGPFLGGVFGKKRAIIGLYVAWLATAVGPISLRLLGVMPANGSPLLLPILIGNYTLAIAFALSCHINIGSCVADSIDDIAVKTGRRSEGLMFAGYSVLDKCANGGGAFVAGAILSFISFPTHALPGTVPQEVLRHMAYVQLPIVVLFNLTSMAFLARYSLTRADHERNALILAERRTG